MIVIIQFIGGVVFLALAFFCLKWPEKCKWMPIYKMGENIMHEKFGLLMVRLSAVPGCLMLAAVLFGFSLGFIKAA